MINNNTTVRRRAAIVVAVIGLGALGLAAPAGAEKVAPARQVPAPNDSLIGQDHPADVFVMAWQYIPTTVHVKRGGRIKFGNYDMYPYGAGITAHSLTEAIPGCTDPPFQKCDRMPRFSSALVDHGYVQHVKGVENLPPGEYTFTCQMHQQMKGTLVIE
jgi:plastocyanin